MILKLKDTKLAASVRYSLFGDAELSLTFAFTSSTALNAALPMALPSCQEVTRLQLL